MHNEEFIIREVGDKWIIASIIEQGNKIIVDYNCNSELKFVSLQANCALWIMHYKLFIDMGLTGFDSL